MSGGYEVISAFLRGEEIGDFSDGVPQTCYGSLLGLSEQGLEFGEGVLDRVEVGTVGRQEEQAGAPAASIAA